MDRERLTILRNYIASLPPERLNMEAWASDNWTPHDCGTAGCVGGHAVNLFHKDGLYLSKQPVHRGLVTTTYITTITYKDDPFHEPLTFAFAFAAFFDISIRDAEYITDSSGPYNQETDDFDEITIEQVLARIDHILSQPQPSTYAANEPTPEAHPT